MATKSISDDTLARALGVYAGMVDRVLRDPERWLGEDEDPPPTAGLPRRALDAVRDRTLGKQNPTADGWEQQPMEKRVDWWVGRIGISAGLAAAAPRVVGILADRVPLQAALGASAAGLAVCAVAREHGLTDAADWVPLLAKVILDRELAPRVDAVPPAQESEQALDAPVPEVGEGGAEGAQPSRAAGLGRGAARAAQTLWRLSRTFLELQHLLDERPRGGFLARTLAKLPVVGVAGGWLDERGAIRKAANETAALLA